MKLGLQVGEISGDGLAALSIYDPFLAASLHHGFPSPKFPTKKIGLSVSHWLRSTLMSNNGVR